MQHIEEAGIHSGDSGLVLPPYQLSREQRDDIVETPARSRPELKVRGLINIQYAIKDDVVYVLEVNPRASRTVPFVSKATGVPLAKVAAQVMAGRKLAELGLARDRPAAYVAVKESVFPFDRFPGATLPAARDEVHRRGHGHRRHLRQRRHEGRSRRPAFRSPRRARCS